MLRRSLEEIDAELTGRPITSSAIKRTIQPTSKRRSLEEIDAEINGRVIGTVQQAQSKVTPSMSTMGIKSYAQAHPFKTAFQDPIETATGKSLLERSQKTPIDRLRIGNLEEPNWSYIPRATLEGTARDV